MALDILIGSRAKLPEQTPQRSELELSPKKLAPPTAAENFGVLVATAMNRPQDADYIENQFRIKGYFDDWELYRTNYLRTKDQARASNIINRAVERAVELGVPANDFLMENPEGAQIVADEAAAFAREQGNPEVAAAIDAIVQSDAQEAADKLMMRQNLVEYTQVQGYELEQELSNELVRLTKNSGLTSDGAEAFVGGLLSGVFPVTNPLLLKKVAELTGTDSKAIAFAAPGTMAEKIRMDIVNMTPEQQKELMREVLKLVEEEPMVWVDYQKTQLLQQLFTPESLYDLNPDGKYAIVDNIWYLVDSIPIVGIMAKGARLAYKGIKRPFSSNATAALKLLNEGDKEKSGAVLVGLADATKGGQRKYGMTQADVGATQVPKLRVFGDDVEDVPESIITALDSRETFMNKILAFSSASRTSYLTDAQKVAIAERNFEELGTITVGGGKPRTNLSTLSFWEDGNGYTADIVFGLNDKRGFRSIRTAIETAQNYAPDLKDVVVYTSVNGKLKKVDNASELLAAGKNARGNFYISVPFERPYTAIDKLLIQNGIVESPLWLGRTSDYLLTPNARFSEEWYNILERYGRSEDALRSQLQALGSGIQRRRLLGGYKDIKTVNQMLSQAQAYGVKNNATISYKELKALFPNATEDQFKMYALERQRADFMYILENRQVRTAMISESLDPSRGLVGARTYAAKDGSGAFHGAEYDARSASSIAGYDVGTKKLIKINGKKEVEKFYNSGGKVIKLSRPFGDGNQRFETIIVNPKNKDWELRSLDRYPLPYIHGYLPRIYLDNHFIEKVSLVTVDGVSREIREVVSTANTPGKAEAVARQLNEKGDGIYSVKGGTDSRLSDGDYVSAALDIMRQEGRLFYDDRIKTSLRDGISNAYADTASPINALNRGTAILARGVALEDVIQAEKASFKATYADRLGIDINRLTSGQVSRQLLEDFGGKKNKLAREAYQVWNHIQKLEKNTGGNMIHIRKMFIRTAQYLEDIIWKTTGKQPELIKDLSRNIQKANPITIAKNLTYTAFIAMRPPKQRLIQSLQHLSYLGIDPVYAGRWQIDSMAFNRLVTVYSRLLTSGDDYTKAFFRPAAAVLRRKPEEIKAAVENFYRQGHRETVDTRAFAGDVRYMDDVPESWLGNAWDRTWGVVSFRGVRNAGERVGFIKGEYFNQSAAFMMALRKYTQKIGVDDWSKLTTKQWDEVGSLANAYSGAMNRMNSSGYQYGYLSFFTQFMQYMHKDLLLFTKAATGLVTKKGALGPKQFTVAEAQRIVATRFLIYGTAGWGIQDFWRDIMEKNMPELATNKYVMQILEGATIDWVMDNVAKFIFQDEDVDFNWSRYAVPAYQFDQNEFFNQLVTEGIRLNFEEIPFAPFEAVYSRWATAARYANIVLNENGPNMTDLQKATVLVNAAGAAAFGAYSDALKARILRRTQRHVSAAGTPSALQAQAAEAWLTLLGVPSRRVEDYWDLVDKVTLGDFGNAKYSQDDMDRDAKQYVKDIMYLYQQYTTVGDPADMAGNAAIMQKIAALTLAITSVDEADKDYIMTKVSEYVLEYGKADKGFLQPLAERIADGLENDQIMGPLDGLKARIINTKAIPEELKPDLIRLVEQHMSDEATNNKILEQQHFNDRARLEEQYGKEF